MNGTRSAEEDQEDVLSAAEGNEDQERRMGVDLLKWWKAAGCAGLHPPLWVNKPVIPIRVTRATTDEFPQGDFLKCRFLSEVWVNMLLNYVGEGVLFQSECWTDSYDICPNRTPASIRSAIIHYHPSNLIYTVSDEYDQPSRINIVLFWVFFENSLKVWQSTPHAHEYAGWSRQLPVVSYVDSIISALLFLCLFGKMQKVCWSPPLYTHIFAHFWNIGGELSQSKPQPLWWEMCGAEIDRNWNHYDNHRCDFIKQCSPLSQCIIHQWINFLIPHNVLWGLHQWNATINMLTDQHWIRLTGKRMCLMFRQLLRLS